MNPLEQQAVTVTVTITGSLSNLVWNASPDPLEVDDENLITYQLVNQSGSPLAFCDVEISPSSPQFQVQSIRANRIELLDQDLSPGNFAVYLWVLDRGGNRHRSPDPQVINRP